MAKAGLHVLTHNLLTQLLFEKAIPADQLDAVMEQLSGLHPLGRVGRAPGRSGSDRVPPDPSIQLDYRSHPEHRRRLHSRPD